MHRTSVALWEPSRRLIAPFFSSDGELGQTLCGAAVSNNIIKQRTFDVTRYFRLSTIAIPGSWTGTGSPARAPAQQSRKVATEIAVVALPAERHTREPDVRGSQFPSKSS